MTPDRETGTLRPARRAAVALLPALLLAALSRGNLQGTEADTASQNAPQPRQDAGVVREAGHMSLPRAARCIASRRFRRTCRCGSCSTVPREARRSPDSRCVSLA
jgi:hypothetical protein